MNKELTLKDVIEVAYSLAVRYLQYDQPIVEYERAKHEIDMGKLESAIRAPFHTLKGKYLINGFYMRAGALFYYLSKSHALMNGNKRLAVTSLMVFMAKNNKWINIPHERLIEISIMIASSDRKVKNIMIETTSKEIRRFTVSSVGNV